MDSDFGDELPPPDSWSVTRSALRCVRQPRWPSDVRTQAPMSHGFSVFLLIDAGSAVVLNDCKLSFFNWTFKSSLMSRTDSSMSLTLKWRSLVVATTMEEALHQLAERLAGVESALM